MPQNDTHLDPEEELTATQIVALEALASGWTVTAAAGEAGVNRVTVHRWLRDDFHFQAALNRARRDLREAAMTRLLNLGDLAAGAVQEAVEHGDVRVAVAVLKGLGLLSEKAIKIGSCDPKKLKTVADQQAKTDALLALF
jgi:hypothetical protein